MPQEQIPIERLHNLRADRVPGRVVFFVHGGGFVNGSPASHRAFASRLGQRCRAGEVWVPDYRLAPEHPFQAALDDVVGAWERLVATHPGAELLLAGDSAGGNLALGLCIAARDRGLPMPKRVYLQSPWLDLTLTSASQGSLDDDDPYLGTRFLERDFARHDAREIARADPRLSPLFADLRDLPPFLLQVGSLEALLDDSLRFVERAKAAGVEAEVEVGDGMWHCWPQRPHIPESIAALDRAVAWLAP